MNKLRELQTLVYVINTYIFYLAEDVDYSCHALSIGRLAHKSLCRFHLNSAATCVTLHSLLSPRSAPCRLTESDGDAPKSDGR